MKTQSVWGASKNPVKFRIPTSDNLLPIRLDIEIDGQRFRDAFTWNPSDPDSEIVVFAKRTVKDLKLPPAFVTQIAQSIQSQLTEFRSYEGQDMYTGEKVVPIKLDLRVNHTLLKDQFLWDLNNFESDPEEFARTFCKDLGIDDPEVGPAVAIAIRDQLYEIAIQSVASAKESRMHKKRKGMEYITMSKTGANAVDIVKLFGNKSSVIRVDGGHNPWSDINKNIRKHFTFDMNENLKNARQIVKRKEWDVYDPIVDLLSNEEVDALEAKEERSVR